jgi:hypothetical protein
MPIVGLTGVVTITPIIMIATLLLERLEHHLLGPPNASALRSGHAGVEPADGYSRTRRSAPVLDGAQSLAAAVECAGGSGPGGALCAEPGSRSTGGSWATRQAALRGGVARAK